MFARRTFAWGLVVLFSVVTAWGAESPWEVRRLRSSDAAKTGGRPAWEVTVDPGSAGAPTVRIAEADGAARGWVYVGRRVRIDAAQPPALAFSYTSFCALDHRSGNVGLALFEPATWDRLGGDADTPLGEGDRALRPLWAYKLHEMAAPDLTEPRAVTPEVQQLMQQVARTYAGRELVLAVTWMAAHTSVERASYHGLQVVFGKPQNIGQTLLNRLDLANADLAGVKACVDRNDPAAALAALVEHFRRRWPEPPRPDGLSAAALKACQQALENRFRSVGSDRFFTLGEDFAWNRNAISDKEWLLHFQWHDWLKTLVEAGHAESDPRYTRKAIELIRDWIPQNYPGATWSWRTLEVALRAVNWGKVYRYLLHAPDFTPADHAAFLSTVAEHFDYLLPVERFHSGHNFGATESRALLIGGLQFPEFAHAKQWRTTAWHRFESEMTAQVLADGAQSELTTGYHNGVLNTFLAAAEMVEGTDLKPTPHYWKQLERMHDYTLCLTKPDGTQPNLGDSWSGSPGRILTRGGAFFHRPDMTFVGSNGEEGERPAYLDTQLPVTGYFVMRTSWTDDRDGLYLCFDAARHWGGQHQHYDALGIILYAHGRTLTPDAGPFAYGSPLRGKFQSTAFHSTVTVDEGNQSTAACKVRTVQSLPNLSFADAEQEGYKGITHRRQILFVRPSSAAAGYFLVVDRITGTGEHTLDAHFHLPAGPTQAAVREVRTDFPTGGNLLVRGLGEGTLEVGTSWITTGYGKKTDRPDVRFRRTGALPAVFVTLLAPYRDAAKPRLQTRLLEPATADGVVAVEVRTAGRREVVFAAPDFRAWSGAGPRVQAQAGLLRLDATGEVTEQALIGRP